MDVVVCAVLNQKGGVGKTTLSTGLSSAAHLEGYATVLVSLDKQGSAVDWAAKRVKSSKLNGLRAIAWDKPLTRAELIKLVGKNRFCFLDCPPEVAKIAESAAILSDIVVIPMLPGPLEFWALKGTLDLVAKANKVRSELGKEPVPVLFIVNGAKSTRLTKRTEAQLETLTGRRVLRLRQVEAIVKAKGFGETILSVRSKSKSEQAAAQELQEIFTELCNKINFNRRVLQNVIS